MTRKEIRNLYKENGIYDFKLRNTEDLFKIHGIDVKKVEGFSELDNTHKETCEEFIVKMFNSRGVKSRGALIPKEVYVIDDIQYQLQESTKHGYCVVSGENKSSLVFKYEHQERNEWVRVDI